jgi:prepilin-type N-terminal cleavage/methylation domain-containing protein
MQQNRSDLKCCIRKKGFTLVELILTISILSIGIVFVLRSFLSITDAINSVSKKIKAIKFLEEKMGEVEEEVKRGIFDFEDKEGEVVLDKYPCRWQLEVKTHPVELEIEEEMEEELKVKEFKEVILSIFWQEKNKERKEVLATYFLSKEE